ncbi:MAG: hypothetical protein ABWY04_07485 [Arthrobacter sp.]
MTTEEGASRLMKSLGEHNKFWTQDMEKSGLEPALMTVMRELASIVGEAPVMLCVGNLVHNVDHGKETYDADGNVVWPEKPNQYDTIVITDQLVVSTWGHISEDGLSVERETTSVKARKHITGVLVVMEPEQLRDSGAVATHHDLKLTFTDGSTEDLPASENELSVLGGAKLAELVPGFYADMAA